jgi:hypothetical protein
VACARLAIADLVEWLFVLTGADRDGLQSRPHSETFGRRGMNLSGGAQSATKSANPPANTPVRPKNTLTFPVTKLQNQEIAKLQVIFSSLLVLLCQSRSKKKLSRVNRL